MARKIFPILEGVKIEAVAAEGKAVAHVNDMAVFVPFVVPGDIVDLRIRKKRKNYAEAEVVRFVEYSPIRVKPVCKHFGVCGGCKWQNLPYDEQLKAKQQQVFDQLTRIGKVELPKFLPILGSEKIYEYRNKTEYGCANKRWYTRAELDALPPDAGLSQGAIGFHITGAFDKIYPIEKCWLMDDLHNQIRNDIYQYAKENSLSFFDIRGHKGLLQSSYARGRRSRSAYS